MKSTRSVGTMQTIEEFARHMCAHAPPHQGYQMNVCASLALLRIGMSDVMQVTSLRGGHGYQNCRTELYRVIHST